MRPLSVRAIARAVGISHTHAGRLLELAERRKLLRRTRSGYAFEKIVVEEEIEGRRWLPMTTCDWRSPIDWREVEGQGEWLPMELFSIRPRVDIWIVKFTAYELSTSGYPPRLGPHSIAIVRRLREPEDAKLNDWCLVELRGRVRSMFRVDRRMFAHTIGYAQPSFLLPERRAGRVAVIETVIQSRTPALNRLQRLVNEAVSVQVRSEKFKDQDFEPDYIAVRVERMRQALRVPHQLKLRWREF